MTIAEQLIKEGIGKGILEGKRKTAKNMLRLGLIVEQVVDAAELSIEEVVQLKKEIDY